MQVASGHASDDMY